MLSCGLTVAEADSVHSPAGWAGLSASMVVGVSGDVLAGTLADTEAGPAAGVVPRLWQGHRRGTGEDSGSCVREMPVGRRLLRYAGCR